MPALSRYARHDYHFERGSALPRPVNHAHENHARRLNMAVDAFESLRPGDASEARLAVQIMVCSARAAASPRRAGVYCELPADRQWPTVPG